MRHLKSCHLCLVLALFKYLFLPFLVNKSFVSITTSPKRAVSVLTPLTPVSLSWSNTARLVRFTAGLCALYPPWCSTQCCYYLFPPNVSKLLLKGRWKLLGLTSKKHLGIGSGHPEHPGVWMLPHYLPGSRQEGFNLQKIRFATVLIPD